MIARGAVRLVQCLYDPRCDSEDHQCHGRVAYCVKGSVIITLRMLPEATSEKLVDELDRRAEAIVISSADFVQTNGFGSA